MRTLTANIPGQGSARICVQDDRIVSVEILGEERPTLQYCSAGLIDIQVNGMCGVDFCSSELTPDALASSLPFFWSSGVTSFCPTLITNSLEQLRQNFAVLEEARRAFPHFARSAPCYHLEGPYLSSGASRGAHDPKFMRAPNYKEFDDLQVAAGGRIGILTLAPELPNALDLIEAVVRRGVRVGISHTDGSPQDIWAAVRAGARLSTHVGNGCPEMIDRHRAPLWAQIAADELYASIICDRFHLPSEVVKIIYRTKGPDKCILITDAIHLSTMPVGDYTLVTTEVELLADGKVIRKGGGSLAGSTLTMDRAVTNFMELANVPLERSLQAAVRNPARLLDLSEVSDGIMPGNLANLVLFRLDDGQFRVESCIVHGEEVYP